MTEAREPRWDRSATIALAGLAAITITSLAWLVLPYYDISNDASLYILTAKALLAGEGYTYLGQPFIIRPPGFSLLLAPVMAWKGVDFHALNLFVNAFGVLGVLLLFVWSRKRVGTWVASAIALVVWFNPGFRHIANSVMSDVPSVALLIGCLLVERWARARPSRRRDAVLGASIGLSAYVRSMNVLLLPAIVASRAAARLRAPRGERRWLEFARGELAVLLVSGVLVMLPWTVRNAVVRPPPPADQLINYSYSTAMWHVDRGDPASPLRTPRQLVRLVPHRVEQLVTLFGSRMDRQGAQHRGWVTGTILLALALFMLWRERRTSDFFAIGACITLFLFISFLDRHALPVYVVVFVAAIEALLLGLRRFASSRASRAFVVLVLLALAIVDFRPRDGWNAIQRAHEKYVRFSRELRAVLPDDARLASEIGWHYAVYLDRPVYSLKFAIDRAKSMESAEAVIDKHGIDTVILWDFIKPELRLVPYFESRYGLHASLDDGGGYIYRVRP